MDMQFRTRKMIAARDLNSNGSLFGGRVELISWSSYYPAYVHLSPRLDTTLLQRTTPWRLGWRPVVRRG